MFKFLYRIFIPIPTSSYTLGQVEDICKINLVPPQKLERFFKESLKQLEEIKGKEHVGDYLEFGVFNGSSMSAMHKVSKELNFYSIRFFGFDAFQGLPEQSEKEDAGVWKKGLYTCSFEDMERCLREQNVNFDEIHWIRGWYDDTLNLETARETGISNIGIVFIDCDTYSSSKKVLDFLAPLIQAPVIICFDDWKLFNLDIKGMGEYKAFNEFLNENLRFKVKEIKSYNRKSKSFIVYPN